MQTPSLNSITEKVTPNSEPNLASEIYKSILDQKKIGVETLKGWDLNTKHKLELVRKLIDSLYARVEDGMAKSRKRNEKVSRFFDQMKMTLRNEFSLKDDENLFGLTKLINSGRGPEVSQEDILAESISQFDREFKNYVDGFKEMQSTFRTHITQKILSENLKPYEERVKLVQNKLLQLQKKIQKTSLDSDEKFENLLKLMKEAAADPQKDKRPRVNFFDHVAFYVKRIEKLIALVKEYGILFLQTYEQVKALEVQRLSSIKNAFLEYIEILSQFFGKQNDRNFLMSQGLFAKINEHILSENQFDLQLLLSASEAEMVLKKTGAPSLTVVALRDFIVLQPYEEDVSELLQRFLHQKYQANMIESRGTANAVTVYSTIDYFCSVYKAQSRKNKPEIVMSIPLEDMQIGLEKGRDTLTFKYTERQFLWKTKKQLSMAFSYNSVDLILNEFEEKINLLKAAQIQPTSVPNTPTSSLREVVTSVARTSEKIDLVPSEDLKSPDSNKNTDINSQIKANIPSIGNPQKGFAAPSHEFPEGDAQGISEFAGTDAIVDYVKDSLDNANSEVIQSGQQKSLPGAENDDNAKKTNSVPNTTAKDN
jgi:hypothetical protein